MALDPCSSPSVDLDQSVSTRRSGATTITKCRLLPNCWLIRHLLMQARGRRWSMHTSRHEGSSEPLCVRPLAHFVLRAVCHGLQANGPCRRRRADVCDARRSSSITFCLTHIGDCTEGIVRDGDPARPPGVSAGVRRGGGGYKIGQFPVCLRYSAGVIFMCRRKMRLRWLWSAKPLSSAISLSARRSLRRC